MRILRTIAAVLIVATPVAIFFWLFSQDASPSGVFTVRHQITDSSPFIDRWLPDTRAINGQVVIDEPVYASVHTPGEFMDLEVAMQFENQGAPIVELGVMVNDDPPQYDLQPLQNLLIDKSDWERMAEGGLVLLERQKVYDSIAAFIADPPERNLIATYNYQLAEPYRIPDYYPSNRLQTVEVSLRGYHEFLTYVKGEPLLVQAEFMDMNRDYGEDPVEILVFNEALEPVASTTVADDGVVEAAGRGSAMQTAVVSRNDLPEGVYKVILKGPRDIFFRRLISRQRYLTFVGPIFLGDEVGYQDTPRPVNFWTNGKHLSFFTYHADAAQAVAIGKGSLALPEAQVRYDYDVPEPGLVKVSAASGDFTFTEDGKTAFAREQFFNPDPARLSWNTDLDDLGIHFIIARYAAPKIEGGLVSASATFDLSRALRQDGDIKLILSAPGVKSLQKQLTLEEMTLTFLRPPQSPQQFFSQLGHFISDLL